MMIAAQRVLSYVVDFGLRLKYRHRTLALDVVTGRKGNKSIGTGTYPPSGLEIRGYEFHDSNTM